ncbi:hypothetical protein LINPERHAP2_LOCUS2551, partial [Linum perenne]
RGLAARNPRRGSGRAIFDGKKRRSKRERWRRWIIVGEERDGSGFMHAVRGGSGSRHRRRAVAEVAGITRRQVESESEKKKGDRHPFRNWFRSFNWRFKDLALTLSLELQLMHRQDRWNQDDKVDVLGPN